MKIIMIVKVGNFLTYDICSYNNKIFEGLF